MRSGEGVGACPDPPMLAGRCWRRRTATPSPRPATTTRAPSGAARTLLLVAAEHPQVLLEMV